MIQRYPVVNVPRLASRPATPVLGQGVPPSPEVQAAAEAVSAAQAAVRNTEKAYTKLAVLIGTDKADELMAEAMAKLQAVQEEYQRVVGQ